jgi:outer membrane protein OmpA-like peptidoglycan-associated protein
MNTYHLKTLLALTAAVFFTSVSVYAAEMANVRYESGKIEWVDVQLGKIGVNRETPMGMRKTTYRITDNNTRVTDPTDKEFLNVNDLWAGQNVTVQVVDNKEGEVVQKIIIGSASADQHQSESLVKLKAKDTADGTIVNLMGPRGPTGAAGSAGEQGLAGARGSAGVAVQGERGQQGAAGPAGERGFTGPRGPAGDIVRGPVGQAGASGSQGQQGEAGKMGKQGISLAAYGGPKGAVGPQGERGPVGDTGAKGPTLYGPQGPAGYAGQAGQQGAAGKEGPQGSATAGIAGLAGPSGAQGAQGKKGATGYQGTAGQVGQWVLYKEFSFNSTESSIKQEEIKMISEIADYMKKNPSLQIGIDGTAVKASDQALNDRRVKTIRSALIDAGMSSDKIKSGEIGDKDLRRMGRIAVLFSTPLDDSLSRN